MGPSGCTESSIGIHLIEPTHGVQYIRTDDADSGATQQTIRRHGETAKRRTHGNAQGHGTHARYDASKRQQIGRRRRRTQSKSTRYSRAPLSTEIPANDRHAGVPKHGVQLSPAVPRISGRITTISALLYVTASTSATGAARPESSAQWRPARPQTTVQPSDSIGHPRPQQTLSSKSIILRIRGSV
jgi:hypothetical protein